MIKSLSLSQKSLNSLVLFLCYIFSELVLLHCLQGTRSTFFHSVCFYFTDNFKKTIFESRKVIILKKILKIITFLFDFHLLLIFFESKRLFFLYQTVSVHLDYEQTIPTILYKSFCEHIIVGR